MRNVDLLLSMTYSGVGNTQGVTRELVDNGTLELPRRDFSLEEHVHFTVGPALGLGKAEEGPHEAEEADTSPEL